jgi:hypothetical protein
MPSLAMGVGLDKHSGPKRRLISEYVSDFTASTDGWNVFSIDADITENQTIDGVDGALFVSPKATVSDQTGTIFKIMDAGFSNYDDLGYSWEFSCRYYRAASINPFQVLVRIGALGSTQNNTVVFGSNPPGVTDAWTDVSLSAPSFTNTSSNYFQLYINSLPAAATGIYFKDITLRVYG